LRGLGTLVAAALREDVGSGDVTTTAIVPAGLRARARIVARQGGVIAGLPVAVAVFRRLSRRVRFRARVAEGAWVEPGQTIAELRGPARALLTGERVALNFLQRLSGIATLTRRCVQAAGRNVLIMDTRKTTPGLRVLEKYAVRRGGGANHRFGLFDQVLIKDNHIRVAGGIAAAVKKARAACGRRLLIEVEAETLAQVRAALAAGADIIMLDNMSLGQMRRAVALVRRHVRDTGRRVQTEASGGITLARLPRVAATGVDRISLGMLTHSAPALDIAMDIEVEPQARQQEKSKKRRP